ncbi:MAG TPA: hypothetical protein VFK89_06885, partial [Actinomycetota bacterium]|nr:hypothetical protein [Actinomycetota bacterium]
MTSPEAGDEADIAQAESAHHRSKLDLAREFILFAPSVIAPAIVGFVSVVVLTRLVDPAPFGRYSLALGVATTVSSIAGDWLIPVAIHFRPRYADASEAEFTTTMARLGGLFAVFAAAVVAALLIPAVSLRWTVAAAALAAAMMLSKTTGGVLRANLRTKRYSIASAIAALIGLGLAIGAFLLTDEPSMLIWGTAVGTALVMGVAG